jgi:hypothetical protein
MNPFSLASLRTVVSPFLVISRIPEADILRDIQRFSSGRKYFLLKILGRNFLLVLLFECETLFPIITLLPVT